MRMSSYTKMRICLAVCIIASLVSVIAHILSPATGGH